MAGTLAYLGGTPVNATGLFLGQDGVEFNTFTAPTTPVQSGLQIWLDAGNSSSYPGTGATWTDLSGNGNNATLVNTPTYSSSDGGYLDFDGVNQYATLYGFSGSLFSTSDWTVQFWSYWDVIDNKCLLSQGTDVNNGGLHLITRNVAGTDKYVYAMFNNDMTSNGTSVTGQWIFTTWTYSDTTYTKQLYVQNTLDKSETQNAYIGTANNTEIGRLGWNGINIYYYNGRIAQMYLYNRILSEDEITQNYNLTKTRYGL
jgi:hypothetical protein